MDSLFPKPKGKVDVMYCVRRHATRVEKVRVLEVAPRYVRVRAGKYSRRDSRKSLYHEYYFHYEQAKHVLVVDYELKIANLRAKLKTYEDELRNIRDIREQDL